MLDRTSTLFSHGKPSVTEFIRSGLRNFFLYRDLGIAAAPHGQVVAHLVKANPQHDVNPAPHCARHPPKG